METGNSQYTPNEQKRQSAAETARKKVLAVYSSAVKNLKKEPAHFQERGYDQQFPPKESLDTTTDTALTHYDPQDTYSGSSDQNNMTHNQPIYSQTPITAIEVSSPNPNTDSDYQQYNHNAFYDQYDQTETPLNNEENIHPHPNQDILSNHTSNGRSQETYADYTSAEIANSSAQNADSSPDIQNHWSNINNPHNVSRQDDENTFAESSNGTTTTQDNLSKNPSERHVASGESVSDNTQPVATEWRKYHSAWQEYYQKYYSDYYAKAAQTYLATEKLKDRRIAAGKIHHVKKIKYLIPLGIVALLIISGLFLQYNRIIFAPIMAYISPNSDKVATSINPVNPNVSQAVSPEPRLIIPKINVDVPVAFNIPLEDVDSAMNQGVAQFSIPGANALPGQVGNLVISGHSAGDIYSSNPYKFIFSGLERLEVGDLIYINYESVRYTYQMTGEETVEPTNVNALIYPTDKPILTLITCTPLGTSRYRLLITAEQINPEFDPANNLDNSTNNTGNEVTMPANSPSFFESIFN